jgi:hypothetical protein
MWLEAVVSQDDIEHVLQELTPTTIELREDGDLSLEAPTRVALVPGCGLEVVCRAHLRWVVLGLHVPVTIESATVLLEPVLRRMPGKGDALAFRLTLKALDVSGVPAMLEGSAVDRVNAELARPGAELVWDFSETLSHRFALPDVLKPARSLDLEVAWGDVRITEDAFVLAISIHSKAAERGATPRLPPVAVRPPAHLAPRVSPTSIVLGAGLAALSIGALGLTLGWALGQERRRSLRTIRRLFA